MDWQTHFARASSVFHGSGFHGSGFHGEPIADKKTPLTADEAARAIALGYKKVVGHKPSAAILGLLLGQWALETGNGASVHNFNFGNKKATASDPYYQYFRCSEVENGVEVFYDPPHPTCKFAAYPNAEAGATAFVESLKRRPHWWAGLQSGNVSKFVQGLATAPAYFTASPTLYESILSNRAANYSALAKQYGASVFWQVITGLGVTAGLLYSARYIQGQTHGLMVRRPHSR